MFLALLGSRPRPPFLVRPIVVGLLEALDLARPRLVVADFLGERAELLPLLLAVLLLAPLAPLGAWPITVRIAACWAAITCLAAC